MKEPRQTCRARAKQKEAEDLGLKEFMSEPLRQKAYQPCGDLWIDFEGHPIDRAIAAGSTSIRRWR